MRKKIARLSNTLARKVLRLNNIWASKYWQNQPFGKKKRANREKYIALWNGEKSKTYPDVDRYEKETGYSIETKWLDDLALHTQIVIKNSPLCYQHGRILYAALSAYLNAKPGQPGHLNIFETGTARGFSCVAMAKALSDNNASGKILTFDVLPQHVPMYWNCIDDCEKQKTREEILKPWSRLVEDYVLFIEGDSFINLQAVKAQRIHFAFLDGAHNYRDVAYEFKTVAFWQNVGDIIVFDDYNNEQFAGLVKAVDDGCKTLGYEKRVLSTGANRAYVIATKTET